MHRKEVSGDFNADLVKFSFYSCGLFYIGSASKTLVDAEKWALNVFGMSVSYSVCGQRGVILEQDPHPPR